MSIRTGKVASVIKQELGGLLQKDYNDPSYGFITVTDVEVTPDLRIAKIHFSIFGSEEVRERAMTMLEEEKPHIKKILAGRIRLRFFPSLEFFRDDTLDRVQRINTILKQIDDERTGRPAEGSNS
jgi:ribosome-binding factor A